MVLRIVCRFTLCFLVWSTFGQEKQPSFGQLNKSEKRLYKIATGINNVQNQYINDSIFKLYYEGVELVNLKVHDSLRLKFYTIFALVFHKKQFPNETIKIAKEAVLLSKNMNDIEEAGRNYSLIAINHQRLHQFDSTTKVYHEVIDYYKKISPQKSRLSLYNNLGMHYFLNVKNNDSALYYYEKLYEIPQDSLKSDLLEWSIKDNIALVYMQQGKVNLAQPLFKKNFEVYGENYPLNSSYTERWIRAGLQWADASIKIKELDKAHTILNDVEGIIEMVGDYGIQREASDLRYLKVKALYFQAIGDYESALELLSKYNALLSEINLKNIVNERKSQYYYRNLGLKSSKKQLEDETRRRLDAAKAVKFERIIIFISIISAVIIAVLIFMRYRQRLKSSELLKKLNAEKYISEQAKKELLEKTIEFKKRDLSDLSINILQNRDWLEGLSQQIETIKGLKGRKKGKEMDALALEVKNKLSVETISTQMKSKVDLLNTEFFETLNTINSSLTGKDIKLCSYIRFNLDNNDIALLQNVALESVYKSRMRLRKKLHLDSKTDLNTFLNSI